MIRLKTVLLRSHQFPLHTLIITKYLTHLNKQEQLLIKTVLQTASNSRQLAEDPLQQSVPQPADYDGNTFFNPFSPTPTVPDIMESSSRNLDPSNMHTFYQTSPFDTSLDLNGFGKHAGRRRHNDPQQILVNYKGIQLMKQDCTSLSSTKA